MINLSLNYSDYIISSNSSVKKRIEDFIENSKEKIKILRMPINTKIFYPDECDYRKREQDQVLNVLNVVSCFAEEKGIETTLKALKILKQEGYKVYLHILGKDEHPERKNFKSIWKWYVVIK